MCVNETAELDYGLIGTRVCTLRRQKGLTQENLAGDADLSVSFLSHIERGTKKGSLDTFFRIACALGVTLDCLLGQVHQKENPSLQDVLDDCTPAECSVIFDIAAAAKESLRKNLKA